MRRKNIYWAFGIVWVCLLLFMQWGIKADASSGSRNEFNLGPKKEGEAILFVYHYKLNDFTGRYEHKWGDGAAYVTEKLSIFELVVNKPAGYEVAFMKFDGVSTLYGDRARIVMLTDHRIDVYMRPAPKYQQMVYYYKIQKNGGRKLFSSRSEMVSRGSYFRVPFITPPIGWHVAYGYHYGTIFQEGYGYTVGGDNVLEIYMDVNRNYVDFHLEKEGGQLGRQTLYYDSEQKVKLKEPEQQKPGYQFMGWKGEVFGREVFYPKDEPVMAPYSDDGHVIDLYPVWEKEFENLYVEYNGNGVAYKSVAYGFAEQCKLAEEQTYDFSFEEEGKLLGWSFWPGKKETDYLIGETVDAIELFEKAKKLGAYKRRGKDVTISFYVVRDNAPKILVYPAYISLAEAQEGKITKEYLCSLIKIRDEDDAIVPTLEGYEETLFINGKDKDVLTLTVVAKDSRENVSKEEWTVFLVGAGGKHGRREGRIRFISKEYMGTLAENSVWRKDSVLQEELLRCVNECREL
ncbi:MAG: hypothetical protein K6A30_01875 [Lachnospiraceae bacterium]|nr:hypothetical protein [Lachnospiraceae bacterium]